MASQKQIMANKTNALKSTGPRSSGGKNTAHKNSLKHGLLSKNLIIRDEDPKEFVKLINNLSNSLQPIGAIEELLVEKIGTILWRLGRIISAEGSSLEEKEWGRLITLDEVFKSNTFASIARYESSLERNFYKALHELQRIQAMRYGQMVLAPIAIDIHGES